MDNRYPPNMPPMGGYYNPTPPNGLPAVPEFYQQQPRLHHLQTMSNESLGAYPEYDEYNRPMLPGQGPSQGPVRSRKRAAHGADHVKHRRTRSGCFTCRQRRVKCDENHPVCDRCIKGKRECNYPDHSSASRSVKTKGKSSQGYQSASPSADELDVKGEQLSPIFDDEQDAEGEEQSDSVSGSDTQRTTPTMSRRQTHSAPTSAVESSTAPLPGPSRRPQPSRTNSRQNVQSNITQSPRWSSLPKEIKFYLKFFRDHMSYHHFAFKYDGANFLKTTYLEIAMNDEALLYAVVSFAAYHYKVRQENAMLSHFFDYYDRSLQLLRQSLMNSKRHTLSRLLTILQLATIEEFLGDWVNLIGHQKAAHQIITDLYTPQTIMQSETHRQIISWYFRFDLFAGMMSGGETVLGREWFAACEEFYRRQSRERPHELGCRFQEWFSKSRLLATDVALLFANRAKGLDHDQFTKELQNLSDQFDAIWHTLKTTFRDPSCFVKEFPRAPPPGPDDITDYRDPNFLYRDDMFPHNYALIDFWAIEMMFKFQTLSAQRLPPTPELTTIALNQCKMFEAIEYSDHGPEGKILGCQASLGIASLFLPKDKKHTDWMRRKFALVEQNGYIYPSVFRKRMTDIWAVDVTGWWLPNNEGYPPIVRAVRDFAERGESMPQDSVATDIKEMSGIFRSLEVSDAEVPAHFKDHGNPGTYGCESMDPEMLYESSPDQTAWS